MALRCTHCGILHMDDFKPGKVVQRSKICTPLTLVCYWTEHAGGTHCAKTILTLFQILAANLTSIPSNIRINPIPSN